MSAYAVATFKITNTEGFAPYPSKTIPMILAHGGEPVVADFKSEAIEGEPSPVTIIIRFDSKEAARAWYDSDDYQAIIHLRTDNTEGCVVLADGFVMPS